MLNAKYQRLPSQHLGRPVHLWTYGWWGEPVLVFPSAAGMAHEWQASEAIDMLRPMIEAGRIKLYCPESNVSVAWTGEGPPDQRIRQHLAYERFIMDELVPYIHRDCQTDAIPISTVGCSFGAYYAVNHALRYPRTFRWALGLSGRYRVESFLHGHSSPEVYLSHPFAHVSGLSGESLHHARQTEITLVVGQGNYEGRCTDETRAMARVLASKGIPHQLDVWGHDVSHEWVWWRRQIRHHFARRFR